jgi:hypothetical protein
MKNYLIPIRVAAMILGAKDVKADKESLSFTLNNKKVLFYGAYYNCQTLGVIVKFRIDSEYEQQYSNIDKKPPIYMLCTLLFTDIQTESRSEYLHPKKVHSISEYAELKKEYERIVGIASRNEWRVIAILKHFTCYPQENKEMVSSLSFLKKLEIMLYAYTWRKTCGKKM